MLSISRLLLVPCSSGAETKISEERHRVLLTRARQGLVIFVPEGDPDDETRRPEYYDGTYEYLKSLGLREI